jgi:hypothetical protein
VDHGRLPRDAKVCPGPIGADAHVRGGGASGVRPPADVADKPGSKLHAFSSERAGAKLEQSPHVGAVFAVWVCSSMIVGCEDELIGRPSASDLVTIGSSR